MEREVGGDGDIWGEVTFKRREWGGHGGKLRVEEISSWMNCDLDDQLTHHVSFL